MVKVVHFPGSSTSYDEAASWIARLDKGISADEREELRRWLEGDRQRCAAFFELAALWDGLDALAELSDLFPLARTTARPRRQAIARWAAAGIAGVAVAVVGLWMLGGSPSDEPSFALPSPVAQALKQDLRTTVGGRDVRTLPDGSVVTLNTDTELSVEYSATARDVVLTRGEASFSVVQNAAKPFRVRVGDRVIQAVGTAFNVQLRPSGEVEVTVTEGRVRLGRTSPIVLARPQISVQQADSLDTILSQGEAAILSAASAPDNVRPSIAHLEPADMSIKLAWQNGMIVFQGEPLPTVLTEVSRYAPVEFVLADDALAAIRVGGYFRTGDIDGLLAALRDNFQIESTVVGDRIVLSAAR